MKRKAIVIIMATIICLSLPITAFANEIVPDGWITQFAGQFTMNPDDILMVVPELSNDFDGRNYLVYVKPWADIYVTAEYLIVIDFIGSGTQSQGHTMTVVPSKDLALSFWDGSEHVFIEFRTITENVKEALKSNGASSWAIEAVYKAITLGLVPLHLQRDFSQPITRAEFAALAIQLYAIFGPVENPGRIEFIDTRDENVEKMAYLGVILGVGNNKFDPCANITREQAAVMLARLSYVMEHPFPQSTPTFADNAQISSWAIEAVGQMQASDIMGGTGNNNFSPSGDYTREQSIITVLRLFVILD